MLRSSRGEISKVIFVSGCCSSHCFGSSASLVQIVAVAAERPVVTMAELPDPSAGLHHHVLRNRHHDAEEVGVLERLLVDRPDVFIFSVLLWRRSQERLKINWTYWSRQAEDRLFGHQPFSEVHVVFKVRKVAHFNPYLY